MSDHRRIVLTADALSDLEGIAVYMRQYSPQNAANVAETILNAIDSLGLMSNRFKQVGISRKRRAAVRAMVVRPFIVYYRVDEIGPSVYVLNIRHGSRRQPRHFA